MNDDITYIDPLTGDLVYRFDLKPVKVKMIKGTDPIDPDILEQARWLLGWPVRGDRE
jgi:hypothetical protein